MKKDFRDLENFLRDARPKDVDASELRKRVWQKVVAAQRRRRKTRLLWGMPPWVWTLASLILILLFFGIVLFLTVK